jgi:NADH dehydrogenase
MAMIGDGAAVAEMGAHHHELHGHVAFAAWLGIHAYLMSGIHERVDSFVSWGWDFVGSNRSGALLDDPERARIDWGDDDEVEAAVDDK